jgi:hypothetical protein
MKEKHLIIASDFIVILLSLWSFNRFTRATEAADPQGVAATISGTIRVDGSPVSGAPPWSSTSHTCR